MTRNTGSTAVRRGGGATRKAASGTSVEPLGRWDISGSMFVHRFIRF